MNVIFRGECSVEGCRNTEVTCGLCRQHYNARYYARRVAKRKLVHFTRLCPVCGRYFELTDTRQLYDTVQCRRRMEYMRRKDKRLRVYEPTPLRVSSAVTDSDVGALAVESVLGDLATVDVTVPVEYFTIKDVVDQQCGVCTVCGESILLPNGDVDFKSVKPLWRIPLDEGGVKTLANRCLVHCSCVGR